MALGLYYVHILFMLIFNFLFNNETPSSNAKYLFRLLLNSLSSTYCYNYYNHACIWDTEKTQKHEIQKHQPSLIRQGLFYLIIFTENIVLTILISENNTSNDQIEDLEIGWLYLAGWAWGFQMVSWLMMIFYYIFHPAAVPLLTLAPKIKVFFQISVDLFQFNVSLLFQVFILGRLYHRTKLQCINYIINALLLFGVVGVITGFRAVNAVLLMSSFITILCLIWL